jgi:hypothetical protein
VLREQFHLAKKAGIGLLESNLLPDWERGIMVNLLLKDLKDEAEAYKYK